MKGIKMHKVTFLIISFLILTLTTAQLATADYQITNGGPETAWVAYSIWEPAGGGFPESWKTRGWYEIAPGKTRNMRVPEENKWVYIRGIRAGGNEIKPLGHATRDRAPFWIHPSEAFTVVETNEGEFLKSDYDERSLMQTDFYKYLNGGSHIINNRVNLPDLPAQRIYDQAINSVLWIHTGSSTGSGVLIDIEQKLAVTNAHVTEGAEFVGVIFPYRDQDGTLIKDEAFYLGENLPALADIGYVNRARVLEEWVEMDLAIIQLESLPRTAREIARGFRGGVESRMRQGDKVHILGNPGNRLWNWTQGSFVRDSGKWLELEGDVHGGNSGGPVLNGQGRLIGIATRSTDETAVLAVPARFIGVLLDAGGVVLPVQLSSFSPRRDTATGTVIIKWTTESELNNAGFYILRSETKTGEFKVINVKMIQGAGTTSEKQDYSYTDTTAKPNVVYYYQIEDISFDGKRRKLASAIRLQGLVNAAHKATMTWGQLKSRR